MKKIAVRFFLLFAFLLSEFTNAWTQPLAVDVHFFGLEISDKGNEGGFGVSQNFYTSGSTGKEKENHNQKASIIQYEEEDKSVSSKKYNPKVNLITSLFFALALGSFYHQIKQRLYSYRHSYFLSFDNRYILFQVFRI